MNEQSTVACSGSPKSARVGRTVVAPIARIESPLFDLDGWIQPFDSINVGFNSTPELSDLDGDGDLDAIVGERYGTFRYFINSGSSSAPAFLEATGIANPLDGFDAGA